MTNKKTYLYLTGIILLQLTVIIFYMTQKIGLFLDELWSYSLSTSINTSPIYDKDFNYNQKYLYNVNFH